MEDITGIVLAGGTSSRMGDNKAELPFGETTMLDHQVEKLKKLGLSDIIISGPAELRSEGARIVPDTFTDGGPMGGLAAALSAARNPLCLVVPVDAPLIPLRTLEQLIAAARQSCRRIILLEDERGIEPLIGIYQSGLAEMAAEYLKKGLRSVRALANDAGYECVRYDEDLNYLINCNTKEEYQAALEMNEQ